MTTQSLERTVLGKFLMTGFWPRFAVLSACVLVAYLAALPLALAKSPVGDVLTTVSAAVCWFGAAASLIVAGWLRGPDFALPNLLIGMFLRMGLPLVLMLMVRLSGLIVEETLTACLVVYFYFVCLVVETPLSMTFPTSPSANLPAKAV